MRYVRIVTDLHCAYTSPSAVTSSPAFSTGADADPPNFGHTVKSPAFRPPVANVLGKGLVWAEGDDHKAQRRIIAPAFS